MVYILDITTFKRVARGTTEHGVGHSDNLNDCFHISDPTHENRVTHLPLSAPALPTNILVLRSTNGG